MVYFFIYIKKVLFEYKLFKLNIMNVASFQQAFRMRSLIGYFTSCDIFSIVIAMQSNTTPIEVTDQYGTTSTDFSRIATYIHQCMRNEVPVVSLVAFNKYRLEYAASYTWIHFTFVDTLTECLRKVVITSENKRK